MSKRKTKVSEPKAITKAPAQPRKKRVTLNPPLSGRYARKNGSPRA
jgi:hypothetical protein